MTKINTFDFTAITNAVNIFNADNALSYATTLAALLGDGGHNTVLVTSRTAAEVVMAVKDLGLPPTFKLVVTEEAKHHLINLNDLDEGTVVITDDIRNLHSGKYVDAYPRRNSNTLKHVNEICVKRSQTVIGWYPLEDKANKKATAARRKYAAVVYNQHGDVPTEKSGPTVVNILDLI